MAKCLSAERFHRIHIGGPRGRCRPVELARSQARLSPLLMLGPPSNSPPRWLSAGDFDAALSFCSASPCLCRVGRRHVWHGIARPRCCAGARCKGDAGTVAERGRGLEGLDNGSQAGRPLGVASSFRCDSPSDPSLSYPADAPLPAEHSVTRCPCRRRPVGRIARASVAAPVK